MGVDGWGDDGAVHYCSGSFVRITIPIPDLEISGIITALASIVKARSKKKQEAARARAAAAGRGSVTGYVRVCHAAQTQPWVMMANCNFVTNS